MITYVLSRLGCALRETLTLAHAPPQACPEQSRRVTLSRTQYLVLVDGTVHHVRRDGVCVCGGTPESPSPAIPLVRDYLAAGGPRPLGRHPDTWPDNWLRVPPFCPICDCPTLPDPYVDSSHGPGWQCTFDSQHYWLVRRSSPWQHIDQTSTRVDGQNQHCNIVCNPLYTIYSTTPLPAERGSVGLSGVYAFVEGHTHLAVGRVP
jgi:hypothetical protein